MEIQINTKKSTYKEKLGTWEFNILDGKSNDLEIVEKSFFYNFNGEEMKFPYFSKLDNISNTEIFLKDIILNNKEILDTEKINKKIDKGNQIELNKEFNIKNNILIKPKLTYMDEFESEKFYYLSETLYSSTVSTEELEILLINKKMLNN